MKTGIFNTNDSVLLVGEGNFSFSVALFRLNLKINITATCYEVSVKQEAAKKNIDYLVTNGVRVLLGVDATKLKEHYVLKTELFDKIIFNFPHAGGKMRIERNRELLKKFFIAAENVLKDTGQALVTLCNGQGGTCMDNPPRLWDNSWKVTDLAAHGNFILTKIELFSWSSFPNYTVTGYRSLEKQFHSEGALTHCFIKHTDPMNIAPTNKINIVHDQTYNFTWKELVRLNNKPDDIVQNNYSHVYTFDITVCINKEFSTSEFYIVLYNHAGLIIDDVNFVRSYIHPIEQKERRTYRISYKSDMYPLHRKRIIDIHLNFISHILESNLNVRVPR